MNITFPTTWNEKPGTNSYGDGIAQILIGARVEGHVLADKFAPLLIKCALENIRRSQKRQDA